MYILFLVRTMNQSSVRKDDPIDNGIIIILLLFFVTVQRIFFSIYTFNVYSNNVTTEAGYEIVIDSNGIYDATVNMRYACMAMEFLLTLIPLRHNFTSENLEL